MELNALISRSLGPIFGMLILIIFLLNNHTLDKKIKNVFYLLILVEFLELVAYDIELWTAEWSKPSMLRIILSIIGYTLRPLLIYIIIMINPTEKDKKWLKYSFIPVVICGLVCMTALFSKVCFYYDENNVFHRGPLGLIAFYIIGIYMILFLVVTIKNQKSKNRFELFVLFFCIGYIFITIFIEMVLQVRSIGRSAIVYSTIFYYMYFLTQKYQDNISEIKKNVEQITNEDLLTGILSKIGFLNYAQKKLIETKNKDMALLFYDIDNFKGINDALGHLEGDNILKHIATKSKEVFGENSIIARFGGDEFYALIENISLEELNVKLAEFLDKVQFECRVGKNVVNTTISIGATFFKSEMEPELLQLINVADMALYEVKNAGRNGYRIRQFKNKK